MFICVSPNPAIDKRLVIDRLIPGRIHRARSVHSHAGGKSAHVAMVLHALGEAARWIGPCGGPTGTELTAGLRLLGIEALPFHVRAKTRTNLEILDGGGTVTEILEPGEAPSDEELLAFEDFCTGEFKKESNNTTVILSGSLPAGSDAVLYGRLLKLAHAAGCRTVLDTSGEPLATALSARPFFVKPNREEAEKLLGKAIDSRGAAESALRQILFLGAQRAAISLGVDGLLYCAGKDDPVFYAPALSLAVRSTVGCGDAALAGFAKSFSINVSPEETIRLAAACASANCLADSPGAIRLSDVENCLSRIRVERQP